VCPAKLTLGGRPTFETVGQIFVERAVEVDLHPSGAVRRMAVSGNSDALVADWEPRNIHGELDDGTEVSIVGAQGGRKRSTSFVIQEYRQEFRTIRHVILNEQVDDRQTFDSCRFRLIGPRWWRSQCGEAASASDGGRLAITEDGDDRWFEFKPAQPLTVRDFDRRVLSSVRTSASLVTDNPASAVGLYVRRTTRSAWRKVHRTEDSVHSNSHELLNSTHLTADRFARWINFRSRSDALDAAAIDDLSGVAIQTAVLTLAAVAEGLHRRLFGGESRVPALSRRDLVQARRAARGAAVERVGELDRSGCEPLTTADIVEFKQAMNDAFGFINEQTFRTRMAQLVSTAQVQFPISLQLLPTGRRQCTGPGIRSLIEERNHTTRRSTSSTTYSLH
jgi:ApeA N-terminal domain 1